MNTKKPYLRPSVLTEDLLEQTSLACNSTAPASTYTNTPGNFGPGAEDPVCIIDVSKGNAFASENLCETMLYEEGDIVALS